MKEKKERVSSMIEPSINSLLEKVDSRYTLVVATPREPDSLRTVPTTDQL